MITNLSEWLIIPFEWQVPIIINECHTKAGSHLRIKPTQDEIINSGYKWDSIYANVREFVMKCQICEISVGKVRKGNSQNHIKSARRLQRFQIDLVQLSNIVATKTTNSYSPWLITFQNMVGQGEL